MVKTWGGGIKDMSFPPCQNMGGIHHPHPPQDLRPCQLGLLLLCGSDRSTRSVSTSSHNPTPIKAFVSNSSDLLSGKFFYSHSVFIIYVAHIGYHNIQAIMGLIIIT